MKFAHILIALAVVAVWGCNFVVIKLGLQDLSPYALCAARFFLAFFPIIFFVKRPKVHFKMVVLYGLTIFALQFTLLFMGINAGMPPGLTSLLLQSQIFFTILLAILFLNETPNIMQIIGALVAFIGIAIVWRHIGSDISLTGFVLVITSAAAWGVGNFITKKIGKVNMFAVVIWGSLVAFPPLCLIALMMDGRAELINDFGHISLASAGAILYITYGATLFGYGVWNWLLSQYPISTVAPFTLLVPIFGMLSSVIVLGEPLETWKLIAGLFVIAGLCINLLGPFFLARKQRKKMEDFSITE